jgi:hypothetical protein
MRVAELRADRVQVELTEAARERHVRRHVEMLIAEEHDAVLEPRVVDRGERGVIEVVEVDAMDDCAEGASDRFDLHRLLTARRNAYDRS